MATWGRGFRRFLCLTFSAISRVCDVWFRIRLTSALRVQNYWLAHCFSGKLNGIVGPDRVTFHYSLMDED